MTSSSPKSLDLKTLKLIVEKTVNAVVITDKNSLVTWTNKGFERITGYSFDEVAGQKPGDILQGPDTDPLVVEQMHNAIVNAQPFEVTILNYRKDRTKYWNSVECQPVFENDELTGFIAIQTDVTETIEYQNKLIQAKKRADENSERFSLAFAGGLVGSWDWSPTEDQLFFHESWERLVGANPGTLEHKLETWERRIHPEDIDQFSQNLARVTRDKHDRFTSEHRILCDRNQYRWTLARGQVVSRDEAGNATRMVGVHLDISEQKRTQHILDEQNDLLQTILEVIPFAVSWKDADLKYLGCNDLFIEFSGYTHRNNILGKSDRDLKPALPEIDRMMAEDRAIIDDSQPVMHKVENRITTKGEQKILDTSKVPLKLRNGTTGLLEISIDATELEMARESLRENEMKLRHSGRMQAVGELAGGVAHEFNNLLQAIRGYVSFAKDEIDPGCLAHNDLKESLTAIDRAAELTNQLLRFSRVEEVEKIRCDPQSVIEDLRVLLRPLLPENISLKIEFTTSSPQILANPLMLSQALLNLCLNSRDAMPDGGMITIGNRLVSSSQETNIVFYVVDTGKGIDESIMDRIFDPFFTTKEVGQGTGLGLAMVYSTVEEHDGRVDFESKPGEGTQFTITLPIANETERNIANQADDQSKLRSKVPTSKDVQSILVAEDDSIVMRVTVRMLQNLGYQVLTATNGRKAVDIYRQERQNIKCLVFDISMPQMTGTKAYDEICMLGNPPPVIFCTGYDSDQTLRASLSQKGYPLINKPFDQATLQEALKNVLEEA